MASKAAREAAEFVFRKGGKEASDLGLETLTRKIESLAARHGDDALTAVKKVGPRTFRLVEESGENGVRAVKLLARYGDEAVWVVAKKNRTAMFVKYGDDAAEAMMKHGEIAEPLISSIGKPAATALKSLSTQNGRRLAIMADEGTLAKIGRTDELLAVIGRYGDGAMNFVWKNKSSLAIAATLAAFLANPQPFIDGTVDISKATLDAVAKPVVAEIANRTDWTLVLAMSGVTVCGILAWRLWPRRRLPTPAAAPSGNPTSSDAAS